MNVSEINLTNFRNYKTLDIKLSSGINVLYGHNAQGKTNVLEALYMCSIGRSHRTHNIREVVNIGSDSAYAEVKCVKDSDDEGNDAYIVPIEDKISILIQKDGKKSVNINGIAIKKMGELFGCFLTVMFSPEDLWLIKSGPQSRRKFMDMELCQLSPIYYYDLKQYYKALNQRNNLLKTIKQNRDSKETMFVWDAQLVEYGIKIMKKREEFLQKLDIISDEIYGKMLNKKEKLDIKYRNNVPADSFEARLEKNIEKDIILGSTSVGIHKDDIAFYIDGNDAKIFGSQGQQRTAAITLKLAEIEIIKDQKNTTPVLLLDDVLSELDPNRQQWMFKCVSDLQVVVTCAEEHNVLNEMSSKMFWVENGRVEER